LTSPRPYVAAAAASVLAALYFVPSATASPDQSAPAKSATSQTASVTSQSSESSASSASTQTGQATQSLGLADTGAIDTTPYVIGGATFLIAGAGLVLNAGRRSRQTAVGPRSALWTLCRRLRR